MKNQKRIIITGALGHIGSKIMYDLPGYFPNAEIILIGNQDSQSYFPLFDLPKYGKYKFIKTDISKIGKEKILLPGDIVIHLAAKTDVAKSFENREETERVNYEGTIKLAEECADIGCSLLFPSSTSVYGTNKKIVGENCPESDLKPQNPYAKSKLKSEKYLMRMGREGRLRFVILRFGTICGISKSMRFHTAVNKFCWQAVLNKQISVWKTALHQKRPYLSIKDASNAITFVINNDIFDQKVYNVATDNLTVNDIVRMIKQFIPQVDVELVYSKIMNRYSYGVSTVLFQNTGFIFSGKIMGDIKDTINLLKKQHGLYH